MPLYNPLKGGSSLHPRLVFLRLCLNHGAVHAAEDARSAHCARGAEGEDEGPGALLPQRVPVGILEYISRTQNLQCSSFLGRIV